MMPLPIMFGHGYHGYGEPVSAWTVVAIVSGVLFGIYLFGTIFEWAINSDMTLVGLIKSQARFLVSLSKRIW